MTGSAPGPVTPADHLSRTISIARLLCVFGIIYVHAWTGLTGDELRLTADTGQGMLRWGLMELLGRSAVPLLSIVSGWLLANRKRRRPYWPFLAGKARTILLPMVQWNALSIVIVSGAGYLGLIQAPGLQSVRWLVDELFCLFTPNDINVQTAFLRDLFLCMAVAPLLLSARTAWLLALIAVLAAWTVSGWTTALVLRPTIPLFFLVGILIRRGDLALRLATVRPIPVVVPALFMVLIKIAAEVHVDAVRGLSEHLLPLIDLLLRPAVALLFWRAAWRLAGSGLAPRLVSLDRYTFFVFCSHLILLWIGGQLIGRWTGPLGSSAYPVFLLVQPVLVFAACIGIAQLLARIAPGTADLLSGGRLGSDAAGRGGAVPDQRRIGCRR